MVRRLWDNYWKTCMLGLSRRCAPCSGTYWKTMRTYWDDAGKMMRMWWEDAGKILRRLWEDVGWGVSALCASLRNQIWKSWAGITLQRAVKVNHFGRRRGCPNSWHSDLNFLERTHPGKSPTQASCLGECSNIDIPRKLWTIYWY